MGDLRIHCYPQGGDDQRKLRGPEFKRAEKPLGWWERGIWNEIMGFLFFSARDVVNDRLEKHKKVITIYNL